MPRGVAQSGSAPGWGPGGRRFKSCLPDRRGTSLGASAAARPDVLVGRGFRSLSGPPCALIRMSFLVCCATVAPCDAYARWRRCLVWLHVWALKNGPAGRAQRARRRSNRCRATDSSSTRCGRPLAPRPFAHRATRCGRGSCRWGTRPIEPAGTPRTGWTGWSSGSVLEARTRSSGSCSSSRSATAFPTAPTGRSPTSRWPGSRRTGRSCWSPTPIRCRSTAMSLLLGVRLGGCGREHPAPHAGAHQLHAGRPRSGHSSVDRRGVRYRRCRSSRSDAEGHQEAGRVARSVLHRGPACASRPCRRPSCAGAR